jgi:hypothetical protein
MTQVHTTHPSDQATADAAREIDSLKRRLATLEHNAARSDLHMEERFQELWQAQSNCH